MPDHIHILAGMTPDLAISDLVRDIKGSTTRFINRNRWVPGKFTWQEGYAAFSHSYSQVDAVVGYIQKQEKHHANKTFEDKYLELLKRFDVEYNPKYVFDVSGKTGRKCNAKVTTIRMPLLWSGDARDVFSINITLLWSGGMKSPSAIDMQEFYRLRYPLS